MMIKVIRSIRYRTGQVHICQPQQGRGSCLRSTQGWNRIKFLLSALIISTVADIFGFSTIIVEANPDAKRIYDDIRSNYNRLIRPVGNYSETLTVKLGLKIFSPFIDMYTSVSYNFPKVYLFGEPLLIVAGFLVLFVTVLTTVRRQDFSISSGGDKRGKGQTSGVHQAVVENTLEKHGKWAGLYVGVESQFGSLKAKRQTSRVHQAVVENTRKRRRKRAEVYASVESLFGSLKAKGRPSGVYQAAVENALKKLKRKAEVYESLQSQFGRLKINKYLPNYNQALKNESEVINELIRKHKAEVPELVESITELQRLDRGNRKAYVYRGNYSD